MVKRYDGKETVKIKIILIGSSLSPLSININFQNDIDRPANNISNYRNTRSSKMKEIEVPKHLRQFMLEGAQDTKLGDKKGAKKHIVMETCTYVNMMTSILSTWTSTTREVIQYVIWFGMLQKY